LNKWGHKINQQKFYFDPNYSAPNYSFKKMAIVTKTINPLPFEYLENRRFEDLTRQLIYDYREWQSLAR
jgi:hypothetical protein